MKIESFLYQLSIMSWALAAIDAAPFVPNNAINKNLITSVPKVETVVPKVEVVTPKPIVPEIVTKVKYSEVVINKVVKNVVTKVSEVVPKSTANEVVPIPTDKAPEIINKVEVNPVISKVIDPVKYIELKIIGGDKDCCFIALNISEKDGYCIDCMRLSLIESKIINRETKLIIGRIMFGKVNFTVMTNCNRNELSSDNTIKTAFSYSLKLYILFRYTNILELTKFYVGQSFKIANYESHRRDEVINFGYLVNEGVVDRMNIFGFDNVIRFIDITGH